MTTSTRRKDEQTVAQEADGPILSAGRRRLFSVLLFLHVAAIFIAPFTIATSPDPGFAPGSPFARVLMLTFQPYIDALFLDHGYAFFAPNPGPPHLFKARLEFADGRPVEELTYPDLKRHWPRLLYHRHFMLSERLYDGFRPPIAPPQMSEDPAQLVAWREARGNYERYYQSLHAAYTRHLRERYGAERVSLIRIEHRLLYPDEVIAERRRIDAPELYIANPEDLPREERR